MSAPRGPAIRLRWGRVVELGATRRGAVELSVDADGRVQAALAYPDLVGECAPGDRVLLNTSAVELGLGTGGAHLVVAVDRDPADVALPGRVMKARYLPQQVVVETLEETDRDALEARTPRWAAHRSSSCRCTRCSRRPPRVPARRAPSGSST